MQKTAFVLSLVFGLSLPGFASATDLKFHLSCDEGKGESVLDKAGKLAGEIKGATWTAGKSGSALYFDGQEKNDCACAVFEETEKNTFFQNFDDQPFSITLWFKPDSAKEHNKQQELLNTGSDAGPGWRLFYFYRMIFLRSGTGEKGADGKSIFWERDRNFLFDRCHFA